MPGRSHGQKVLVTVAMHDSAVIEFISLRPHARQDALCRDLCGDRNEIELSLRRGRSVESPVSLAYLVSLSRRLGTRAPAHASLVTASLLQPLLRANPQLPLQFRARFLPMYEIAKATSYTPLPTIQPTASLPKVRHRAQLTVYRPRSIPPTIQRIARRLRRVLVLEPRVDVPNQVVVVIVAHHDFLQFAVLAHLAPKVLVEGVKVVLHLRRVHLAFGVVGGVLVEVGQEDGLAVGGLDMLA